MTLANYTPAKCLDMGWGNRSFAFSNFMNAINSRVEALCLLSIEDLPDWPFADEFEDGVNPNDVADDMLADNGWVFED